MRSYHVVLISVAENYHVEFLDKLNARIADICEVEPEIV